MNKRPHKLFDKVLGGYVPASFEGCFVYVLFILAAGIPVGLGILLARAFDSPIPQVIGWGGFGLIFIYMMKFMKRHG